MSHDILIVDDEADIRMLIGGILEDDGHQTRGAGDSTAALEAIRARRPSLVVLDVWLQGSPMDGLEVLDVIRREHPDMPVVIISGHGNVEMAVGAIKRGAYDFIEKPFKADRLLLVVQRAVEAARLRRENEELKLRAGGPPEIVGGSASIVQVRQQLSRVAPTGSRVLLAGPAGSGKEVAARLIHALSKRVDGPFVVLNCASLRPNAMEIEMFGIEPGSPIDDPDAPLPKIGVFEKAHNGTLYLDEVADMPLETQGKIVRVLQEQSFERVGGRVRVQVDVRVVASTNRDLQREILDGRFREDLFYRLNVVPIRMPALKERREDIPVLAAHFMERAAQATGTTPRAIADDAIATMQTHEWPGNVRQLRNVVEWLLIMSPGDSGQPVKAENLPPDLGAAVPTALRGENGAEIMGLPLREARELFERQYLIAQVTRFGGNISRTASFVGMERSALHRKLKALGVHGADRERGPQLDA
jgi:two-component system, NtrC family, nitrogen regulation response regulator NtrX